VSGRREPGPCPQCGKDRWRVLGANRSRKDRWECRGCGLQVSGPDRRQRSARAERSR